jgi:hypothetical protein
MYEHIHNKYKFIKRDTDNHCCIQLLVPPFTGLIFHYKRYQLVNLDTDEEGIQFEYEVDHIPETFEWADDRQEVFDALLGQILLGVLEEMLKSEREDQETIEFDGGEEN